MYISELYEIYKKHPSVTTDSRNCPPDSIFFALKGKNFDGNNFAEKALESGCSYAVVDNGTIALKNREKMILTDNVLTTLQQLARLHRETIEIQLIAITGTNGKTTTKELTAAVLSQQYKTLSTQGNLNNHIGVPLTLLKLTEEHELAVIEMGASHPGEIRELCEIARPDYGLITNAGQAHLEGFGSLEGVIKTKGELYDFIRENNGFIFVCQDNDDLMKMTEGINTVTYGRHIEENTFIAGKIIEQTPFIHFQWINHFGRSYSGISNLAGDYNIQNIIAAVTVGFFFDVEPRLINKAIGEYLPSNNRSQYRKTNDNELIIDAYNANHSSMTAAMANFSVYETAKKAVILGDMLELGDKSIELHEDIIRQIEQFKFEKVLLCGDNFSRVTKDYACFEDVDTLAKYLIDNPIKGYHVLIKGSRGIRLEKIIDLL